MDRLKVEICQADPDKLSQAAKEIEDADLDSEIVKELQKANKKA